MRAFNARTAASVKGFRASKAREKRYAKGVTFSAKSVISHNNTCAKHISRSVAARNTAFDVCKYTSNAVNSAQIGLNLPTADCAKGAICCFKHAPELAALAAVRVRMFSDVHCAKRNVATLQKTRLFLATVRFPPKRIEPYSFLLDLQASEKLKIFENQKFLSTDCSARIKCAHYSAATSFLRVEDARKRRAYWLQCRHKWRHCSVAISFFAHQGARKRYATGVPFSAKSVISHKLCMRH